ncbi:MAG TPA: hypothetical protein VF476_19145 [Chitinophagaceae bacterium]
MGKLKDDILKLSKAEQYELYEALELNLFGEEQRTLTKDQLDFINERLAIVDAGKARFISPDELRKELDNILG